MVGDAVAVELGRGDGEEVGLGVASGSGEAVQVGGAAVAVFARVGFGVAAGLKARQAARKTRIMRLNRRIQLL
jgi:hypothetical protein